MGGARVRVLSPHHKKQCVKSSVLKDKNARDPLVPRLRLGTTGSYWRIISCQEISKRRSLPSPHTTSIRAIMRARKNLTPADVYTGRCQTILLERKKIKRRTMKLGCLQHATTAS